MKLPVSLFNSTITFNMWNGREVSNLTEHQISTTSIYNMCAKYIHLNAYLFSYYLHPTGVKRMPGRNGRTHILSPEMLVRYSLPLRPYTSAATTHVAVVLPDKLPDLDTEFPFRRSLEYDGGVSPVVPTVK